MIAIFSAPAAFTAENKRAVATVDLEPKVKAQSRTAAFRRLAVKLRQQSRDLAIENNSISKANSAKLQPVLRRQKNSLLSPQVLAVDPNSEKVLTSSVSVSNFVVGSIKSTEDSAPVSQPLARFHRNLKSLKSRPKHSQMTILHIAPDGHGAERFVRNLGNEWRKHYGNAGHGMVSPARTSQQSNLDNFQITRTGRWRTETNRLRNKAGFGLSGMRLSSRSSLSSISFTSQSGTFDWAGITVSTGPSQGVFTLKIGDVERKFDAHAKTDGSKFFKMDVRGTKATVIPGGGAKTGILSWHSGNTQPGMRYVGFQLSKTRDGEVEKYDAALLRNDLHQLAPDLVIIDHSSGSLPNPELDLVLVQITASVPQAELLYLTANSASNTDNHGHCDPAAAPPNGAKMTPPPIGAAQWSWRADATRKCSIGTQVRQSQTDFAIPPVDLGHLRATALIQWLASPVAVKPVLANR